MTSNKLRLMSRRFFSAEVSVAQQPAFAGQNCSVDALCLFRYPWAIFLRFLERNRRGQSIWQLFVRFANLLTSDSDIDCPPPPPPAGPPRVAIAAATGSGRESGLILSFLI